MTGRRGRRGNGGVTAREDVRPRQIESPGAASTRTMVRPRRNSRAVHLIGLGLVAATTAVFSHRDRTPEDPELVSLVATADREAIVAGHATTTVVRLEVAAATRTDDAELGVNLGLLLDTSGSMAGEPIEQARAAVHALVDELRPQDRLTVVTFDSRAQLVQASAKIDDVDLRSLHARIDEIRAEGTTDLAAGLGTLLAQLNGSPTVGDLDRIVIVGDGVPNDARPIAGQVEAARQAGYAITTLGVGLDYDEVLLGEVARNSGGRFHHLECGADLSGSFAAELFGAQRQIAANVSLQLSTGPGVTIERVVGHGATMSGVHQHAVVLGELAEGESQEVFVELAVDAAEHGTTLELLDAVVTYDDRVGGAGRLERRAFSSMPVSADLAVLALRDADVERGVVAARAAAATIDAIAMARRGDLDGADSLLHANEQELSRSVAGNGGEDMHEGALVRQRDELIRLRGEVRNVAAPKAAAPEPSAGYRRVAKEANATAVELLQAHR